MHLAYTCTLSEVETCNKWLAATHTTEIMT